MSHLGVGLWCADEGKVKLAHFNFPHVQHIGPIELTSEFTVVSMLPLHLVDITGPCTFTCAPSNNDAGLLFFYEVALERLTWTMGWNKELHKFEPDCMLEHPSVMSDGGLLEEERAEDGLAMKMVHDISTAGVRHQLQLAL